MTIKETQDWFESESNNPYLIDDVSLDDTMMTGIAMPVSGTLDGTPIYIIEKTSEYMDYYPTQGDALAGTNKKTVWYNADKGLEYATHLEMNGGSTSLSKTFKSNVGTTDRRLIRKPGADNLFNAAAVHTKGLDQMSMMINQMSDDVCGVLGGISNMGVYSETLRMLQIMACILSKMDKFAKIMTDNAAARNIFGRINALKNADPTAALKMLDKLQGAQVDDMGDAEALCKLVFAIIDNFLGDMKDFLTNILTLPGDLKDIFERFTQKMIDDITKEVQDCINKADGMFTVGLVVDAIVERDVATLINFQNGGASVADDLLPAGVTLAALATMALNDPDNAVSNTGEIMAETEANLVAANSSVTTDAVSSDASAESMVTSVMETINAQTNGTDQTTDTTTSNYLEQLANDLKDKDI